MNRRGFINKSIAAGFGTIISTASLEKLSYAYYYPEESLIEEPFENYDIIPAPEDHLKWDAWRASLHRWREKKRLELKYDGSSYRRKSFDWVTSDFSCCFLMICDSDFYSPDKNEYTISSLITRAREEYGGYDSIVLWHAYPRIGLDDRNQFDFYREMPQGLPGVKDVVRQFHDHGVKVFINYNPWDTGTRREKSSDIDLLIDIIRSIDADGIFLDTMKDAPDFREKLDKVKEGIVLEGEIALPLEHIHTHHMSWAQWFPDSNVPGVYTNKWFERRHMQHAINRWSSDKTPQLHAAWMNGSGILIWENVFGQWLGWNKRDLSTYRAMYNIQHQFAELFSGEDWIPLSCVSPVKDVYISSWNGTGITIFTLVNRSDSISGGTLFRTEEIKGRKYFDLIRGVEIIPGSLNGCLSVTGTLEAKGIGCILSIASEKIDTALADFIERQKVLSRKTSADTSVPVKNIGISNPKEVKRSDSVPEKMAVIPATTITMTVEYTFREPGGYGNIQDHLQLARQFRLHSLCRIERKIELKPFAIDITPVTNLEFMRFLNTSGYKPRISENFLKHWLNGRIPSGKEDHPVVYVDRVDARAYAEWDGKRLPTEEEWQFAAQGPASLTYPWGNEMEPGRCNPDLSGKTTPVNAFPIGASPYGCLDMCGNTWELTGNEYSDGRTRFVMLKGGSCYKAQGSDWYFDGGPQKNNFVAKMLLIWPGLDRCATVGFRCAVDL